MNKYTLQQSLLVAAMGTKATRLILAVFLLLTTAAASAQVNQYRRVAILNGDYSGLPVQNASDGPEFGFGVAMDGHWLAVGAPGAAVDGQSGDAAGAGVVFMFKRENGIWQLKQRLHSVFTNMRCGTSVALKLPYLVVGCPGIPGNTSYDLAFVGRARLSESDVWEDVFFNTAGTGSGCGTSVTLSDVRADGSVVAAAGCPDEFSGKGRVVPAQFDGGDWVSGWDWGFTSTSAIIASDGAAGDRFGEAVAIHRACGILCFQHLAVGAPSKSHSGADNAGSVYLFGGPDWTQSDIFTANPANIAQSFFGSALVISNTQLVIGVLGGGAQEAGYVSLWNRSGDNWQRTQVGSAINAGGSPAGQQAGMQFGGAMTFGPGGFTAIAAPFSDGPPGGTQDIGMVELRQGSGGYNITDTAYAGEVRPPSIFSGPAERHFGTSVDFGGALLAVGYPHAPGPPSGEVLGQVWIYDIGAVFADRFEQ